MKLKTRKKVWEFADKLLSKDEIEKIKNLKINDAGYGYDSFGLEKESAALAYIFARLVYKYWFRVESQGHENIPKQGAAILAANHSGVLPLDGAMIGVDLIAKNNPPRILRSVIDYFTANLPYINLFMFRAGQVIGHRKNFLDLLNSGELVGVFPEGVKGIGKPYKEAYHLRKFNVGFIELSLIKKAPIVPCCVIGSEEQAPMLYNLKTIARLLKFPYFPITVQFPALGPLGLLPLPVKYHIYYGEPFRFFEQYDEKAALDSEIVKMLADKVQLKVQEMIEFGLKQRKSIFGLGISKYLDKT